MTAHIAVQADGRHVCYRVTASGKGRAYEGCDHLTPRDAIRHSDTLDATPRSADELSTRVPGRGTRDAGRQSGAPLSPTEPSGIGVVRSMPAVGSDAAVPGGPAATVRGAPLPVAATPPRQSATPPAGASPDAASRTPVASVAPRRGSAGLRPTAPAGAPHLPLVPDFGF